MVALGITIYIHTFNILLRISILWLQVEYKNLTTIWNPLPFFYFIVVCLLPIYWKIHRAVIELFLIIVKHILKSSRGKKNSLLVCPDIYHFCYSSFISEFPGFFSGNRFLSSLKNFCRQSCRTGMMAAGALSFLSSDRNWHHWQYFSFSTLKMLYHFLLAFPMNNPIIQIIVPL